MLALGRLGSMGITGRRGVNQFYVDPVLGNDANSGRTSSTPFLTFAALPATIRDGTYIYLFNGKHRGKISLGTAKYVTIEGQSQAAIVCCDDVVSSGAWSNPHHSVYKATLTVQPDALAAEWPAIWVNDTRLTFSAVDLSDAANAGVAGTFWYSAAAEASSVDIYIVSTGSTDPRSDGKVYEAAVRNRGIDAYDATYCTIKNLRGRRAYASYGSVTLGQYCIAQNVRCSDGNTHSLFYRPFAALTDCLCDEAYNHTTNPTLYIGYEGTPPAGATAVLTRCEARMAVYDSGSTAPLGFYNHTGGGSNWTKITYQDCTCTNLSAGFEGANVDEIDINNPTLTGTKLQAKTSATLTKWTGGTVDSVPSGGQMWIFDAASIACIVDGVTGVINATGSFQSTFAGTSMEIKNCTLTGMNVIMTNGGQANQIWNHHNNTYVPNGHMLGAGVVSLTGTGLSYTSDNNYYGEMTGGFIVGAGTYADFWAYQAGGYDTNSLNEPPTSFLSGLWVNMRGGWYTVSPTYAYSDSGMTTPAVVGGQVAKLADRSGAAKHLTFTGSGRTLRQDGNGKYYIEMNATDDFAVSAAFTFGFPIYMACAISKGSQVAQALFGATLNAGNYARIGNISSSSRAAGQNRRASGTAVNINTALSAVPISTPIVLDAYVVAGTTDIGVNGGTPLTTANALAGSDTIVAASIGVNANAATTGAAQLLSFYGGIMVWNSAHGAWSGLAGGERATVNAAMTALIAA